MVKKLIMEQLYTIEQIKTWLYYSDSHDIKDACTISPEDLTHENIEIANQKETKEG